YLDIFVKVNRPLTDKQFEMLPDDLKNKYIGFGVGLTNNQYRAVQQNSSMVKRYRDITLRKIEEMLKSSHDISLKSSEINIFIDSDKEFLDKVISSRHPGDFLMNLDQEGWNKLNAEQRQKLLSTFIEKSIPTINPEILLSIL